MGSPGWLGVPQALGRGNSSSWISTKYAGLHALHAGVRQGPFPELWACPVPCLAWPVGAAPLASLPAKNCSEGEKKFLTLKP